MELTKEEILIRKELEKLYPQLLINSRKTCGAAFDKHGLDLIAVAVEFFLSKPIEDQIATLENGKMENFITFIMAMQLKSGSSRFYNQYRRHHEKQRELYDGYDYGRVNKKYEDQNDAFSDEESEVVTCMKCEVEKLDPYLKMLVNEKLIAGHTYKFISDTYNINYGSLKSDTQRAINLIKEKCQHLY